MPTRHPDMRSASALHDWYRTLISVDAPDDRNAGPAVLRKSAADTVAFVSRPVAFASRPITAAMLSSRPVVRVLGPIEVVVDGAPQPIRPMARRLLAILAAAPGRVIRTDQILDQLWPETRPATANKTLQTHIVHLRRALGPNAIAHRSGGYLLATAVVALDARDLEALAQQAENAVADGRIDEASGALESAVRLLRGMPFDEFAVDEFAIAEVARSQELAWRAIELRAECAIEKGTAPAAISYLERLVAEQPLRESAWTVLIQAQVAAGRRGDATRTAERARASLRKSSGQGPDRPYGRPRRRFRSRSPTWLRSSRFLRVSLRSASPRCGAALTAGVAQRFVDDGGIALFGRADADRGVPRRPVDFEGPDFD